MKIRSLLITALLFTSYLVWAQCPQQFNYQVVIRNAQGNPLPNTTVCMRFTINNSVNPGVPVYREDFTTATNQFGCVVLHPGTGTVVSGVFSSIDWASGFKYMMVETDLACTGAYVNMGTEQLVSVPYALYADSAAKGGFARHYAGQYYGGGIVFYVTDNGLHGYIADSTDLQTSTDTVLWANIDTTLVNAPLQGTGGGYVNTERIVLNQGNGNYAAQLCANYTGGGYGDWFLPSVNELALLYQAQQVVGGFNTNKSYWTSTEITKTTAAAINFATGVAASTAKANAGNVRAIRVF